MTQDEIIEMGQEAGLSAFIYPHLISESEWKQLSCFIELVAAKEREACAKVCDEYANGLERNYSEIIADAIRARGEQA
jgi:hypothetical protein